METNFIYTFHFSERNKVCLAWVEALSACNIPLSKTDNPAMRRFLQNHVVNGGAIPMAQSLQRHYLEELYTQKREEIKLYVQGKSLAIMTDEMSDANGRYVGVHFFFF